MFSQDGLHHRRPTTSRIVVYCYTGQTASQVTSALNMLGYDASNMLFGMQAWTMDKDVRVKGFNAETHTFNYPYEGTAAAGAGEATTEETTTERPPSLRPCPRPVACPSRWKAFWSALAP